MCARDLTDTYIHPKLEGCEIYSSCNLAFPFDLPTQSGSYICICQTTWRVFC